MFMGCAMLFLRPQQHLPPFRHVLLIAIVLVYGRSAVVASSGYEEVLANSNQAPAGRLHNGTLTISVEAAMGKWYPEENDGPGLQVAAFREEGGHLSTPGPLLCVAEGTEINAIVYNRLEQPLTVAWAASWAILPILSLASSLTRSWAGSYSCTIPILSMRFASSRDIFDPWG